MSAPIRVVIVEDNPADVLLLREALRQQDIDFSLEHYGDGEEAARAITRMTKNPDLVLLDINIPRINGLELLAMFRHAELTSNTPIAMFTSSQSVTDRREAERLGANGYIVKPPSYDEFMSQVGPAIRRLLKLDSVSARRCRRSGADHSTRKRALVCGRPPPAPRGCRRPPIVNRRLVLRERLRER